MEDHCLDVRCSSGEVNAMEHDMQVNRCAPGESAMVNIEYAGGR